MEDFDTICLYIAILIMGDIIMENVSEAKERALALCVESW